MVLPVLEPLSQTVCKKPPDLVEFGLTRLLLWRAIGRPKKLRNPGQCSFSLWASDIMEDSELRDSVRSKLSICGKR
jgi:hypothetical protein